MRAQVQLTTGTVGVREILSSAAPVPTRVVGRRRQGRAASSSETVATDHHSWGSPHERYRCRRGAHGCRPPRRLVAIRGHQAAVRRGTGCGWPPLSAKQSRAPSKGAGPPASGGMSKFCWSALRGWAALPSLRTWQTRTIRGRAGSGGAIGSPVSVDCRPPRPSASPDGRGRRSAARRRRAQRSASSGLLPRLAPEEALALAAVRSVAGRLPAGGALGTVPPFVAPHPLHLDGRAPRRWQRDRPAGRGVAGPWRRPEARSSGMPNLGHGAAWSSEARSTIAAASPNASHLG